ncbi:BZ3500_MvSof-1268-A1-R1_Chr10-1g02728 [Microbotryum saponariae]|uniref:BZ3500_MvSof-1268-A1-R1_Chr10-1g02728 protein n=1 Tax=Microbotryum saponariae TaxID=289078 RepID=A0A2X0L8Y4_9BASI|nr:BZ3500_MvSof-1268-A1-R1_Chr10-1g02728 [Microbotryum saponariae]SDA06217.1 BZ3501_MvSof-1269-A2-R1_Chr10-1g02329 [Microbotryum saponariae]
MADTTASTSKLTMDSSVPERHRVSVSYSCLPSLSDYEPIRADVQRQSPLRNLHWVRKTGANRSVRTIQSLPIVWRPLDSNSDLQALSLLERPYLHVLFVACEDNETYRATLRPQIREWLDTIQGPRLGPNQEWLIVHVTTARSSMAKFYQRKSAVVDKIKADFNTGKKDRCIQVGASADDPTAWAEFSNKVKEGVLTTFDTNVSLYEENVRKADSQRQLEGWQFQPFFLQKEVLADSFEAIGLLEDALIQYDELEAAFFQALKTHDMAWFGAVGGLTSGDDTLPLLSTTNKPYRSLIQANKITMFDFRIYIFARQASLLSRLGRIAELARRGAVFVSTFARTLREHQATWTYSACLNIVDNCQVWIEGEDIDRKTAANFVAVKAELLELARKQLDKIGIGASHLPPSHPFSMSLNEPTTSIPSTFNSPDLNNLNTHQRPPVTRQDLLNAIKDGEAFDKLFIDLTNRSIQAYSQSGRKRCSLKLHASLAALENHRDRAASAQKLFSHLPAHYIDLRWTRIEASLLSECTRLQGTLDMNKEELLSTLALVRAGVEFESKKWDLRGVEKEGEDEEGLAKRLMKDVYELSKGLSKDFAAIAFPTFSMRLANDRGTIAQDEDGVNIRLIITNLLPCALDIDEVRLKFAKPDGEQVWFTAGQHTLVAAGQTEVELFCPTAVAGRLLLELSQIRFSRIIFQYSHRPVSSRNLAPDPRNMPLIAGKQPVAFFPRDYQALDVTCRVPHEIHLDQERTALIRISVGRNQVTRISLKITTGSKKLTFAYDRSRVVLGQAQLSFASGIEDTLILDTIQSGDKVIEVELPLVGRINDPSLNIGVVAEYLTVKRPATRRLVKRTLPFKIALPLAVNVQDFFREDRRVLRLRIRLLSKFSVTTDGVNALRIKSAHLEDVEGVTAKPCRSAKAPVLVRFMGRIFSHEMILRPCFHYEPYEQTILPFQTANFLFNITKESSGPSEDPLRLTLAFCTLEEDIRTRVAAVVEDLISTSPSLSTLKSWLLDSIGSEVVALTSVEEFAIDPDFRSLEFDEVLWNARISSLAVTNEEEAMSAVRQIFGVLSNANPAETSSKVEPPWRQLTIPVDLPSLNVLNLVHFTPDYLKTEIGQALPVTLSIRPTFQWSNLKTIPTTLHLMFDLTINPSDWFVAGKKKGEVVAVPGEPTTIRLWLVPVRAGALFLPSVVITPIKNGVGSPEVGGEEPLDLECSCESQNLNAARVIEVLPLSSSSTFEIEDLEQQTVPIAV